MNLVSADPPQPLTSHLEELRRRIIVCVVAFLCLSGIAYYFVDPVLEWLARPVGGFVFSAPTDAFFIRFKISFGLGGALTVPLMIYNGWRFVEIALYPKERFWVRALIPFSCALFFFGVALALFGVAPVAVKFLMQFSTPALRPLISIQDYLSFLFWMVAGFGILFQLPLVVVILARLGVVHPKTLAKYRRHAIVGIVFLAAVLTPGPDMFSQLLLAVPTYLLFECSLLVARRFAADEDKAPPP